MDRKQLEALKAQLVAEAEEFEARAAEAIRSGKRSAQIGYVVENEPTGQVWASVEVVGPSGAYMIVVPKKKAERHAKIINEVYKLIGAILLADLDGDYQQVKDLKRRVTKILNAGYRGRPRLPKEARSPERVTKYLDEHGLEATVKETGLPHDTVLRYQRKTGKRRG
jgi:hypothetical protein